MLENMGDKIVNTNYKFDLFECKITAKVTEVDVFKTVVIVKVENGQRNIEWKLELDPYQRPDDFVYNTVDFIGKCIRDCVEKIQYDCQLDAHERMNKFLGVRRMGQKRREWLKD